MIMKASRNDIYVIDNRTIFCKICKKQLSSQGSTISNTMTKHELTQVHNSNSKIFLKWDEDMPLYPLKKNDKLQRSTIEYQKESFVIYNLFSQLGSICNNSLKLILEEAGILSNVSRSEEEFILNTIFSYYQRQLIIEVKNKLFSLSIKEVSLENRNIYGVFIHFRNNDNKMTHKLIRMYDCSMNTLQIELATCIGESIESWDLNSNNLLLVFIDSNNLSFKNDEEKKLFQQTYPKCICVEPMSKMISKSIKIASTLLPFNINKISKTVANYFSMPNIIFDKNDNPSCQNDLKDIPFLVENGDFDICLNFEKGILSNVHGTKNQIFFVLLNFYKHLCSVVYSSIQNLDESNISYTAIVRHVNFILITIKELHDNKEFGIITNKLLESLPIKLKEEIINELSLVYSKLIQLLSLYTKNVEHFKAFQKFSCLRNTTLKEFDTVNVTLKLEYSEETLKNEYEILLAKDYEASKEETPHLFNIHRYATNYFQNFSELTQISSQFEAILKNQRDYNVQFKELFLKTNYLATEKCFREMLRTFKNL
uniref:Dimer_Tnp_hAT domain-containing protein n=1 Tax=Rhabditophanes sp. KR3021 TaxID=114890 RepID=A0AC35U906_9BILA